MQDQTVKDVVPELGTQATKLHTLPKKRDDSPCPRRVVRVIERRVDLAGLQAPTKCETELVTMPRRTSKDWRHRSHPPRVSIRNFYELVILSYN